MVVIINHIALRKLKFKQSFKLLKQSNNHTLND